MGPQLIRAALAFTGLYVLLFAPTIAAGRLLAPGDSILQSVPALYSQLNLWTPFLFSGYPLAGDPQSMTWYPLAWIFSWGVSSWNVFVISAYVLASTFTYGYVWSLTRSNFAAAASGVMYGLSGFLMSALPHPHLVHSAAWLPLMVWSLRELHIRVSRNWIALLSIAIACSALAGHPQVFVYSLGLSLIYACFKAWTAPAAAKTYVLACSAGIGLGLAMAAILLLPLAELASQSVRADSSFEFFVTGSLPPDQVPALLFPLQSGDLTRLSQGLYVGLFAFLLASVGIFVRPKRRLMIFWIVVAIISFLLALGAATPLARLMYLVPGFQAFRAPVRHFLEFSFSIAVLAGISLSALRALGTIERRRLVWRGAWAASGILVLAAVLGVFSGISGDSVDSNLFSSLVSSAFLTQFAVLGIVAGSVLLWARRPTPFREGLIVLLIVLDLMIVGGALTWQDGSPSIDAVSMPEPLARYRDQLVETGQRFGPLDGLLVSRGAGQPNMSGLWEIPSAGGYNPLILSRYSEFLGITPTGQISPTAVSPTNRALDLLGVRYATALVPRVPAEIIERNDMSWPANDLNLPLGSGCGGDQPDSLEFPLAGISVRRIGLVTGLACSAAVPEGSEVLRITLTTSGDGPPEVLGLRAGTHTAEWAWERSDVQPIMAHERAPVFGSSPNLDGEGVRFDGHQYLADLTVASTAPRDGLRLDWIGPAGEISVAKLVLEDLDGVPYAIGSVDRYLVDGIRWNYVEHLDSTPVFENQRAMPRVWLTPDAVSLDRVEILRAVHDSILPSGEVYDPYQVALVEGPIDFDGAVLEEPAIAEVVSYLPGRVEIEVVTGSPAFLVLADTYYPGWIASIDGARTQIYRTNYVLRGVRIGPGEHNVVFTYRPVAFYVGAGISLAGMGVMLIMFRPGTRFHT